MSDDSVDRFWQWFDGYADGYRWLTNALNIEFHGANFAMEHTGGGCMAITAKLEGYEVYITDAEDTLSSPGGRSTSNPGYAVGVYRIVDGEADSEPSGWAYDKRANNVSDVTELVKAALADAIRHGARTRWVRC